MFVCVSKDSSFLSWNVRHSSSPISKNRFYEVEARWVYCRYTPVSVFWHLEGPLLSPSKILVSWESQEEYVWVECQGAAQQYFNPSESLFYFACWGYGLTRKKPFIIIKSHPEGTEIAVYSQIHLWLQYLAK